ncbi:MAG: tyrosine--tRNA ligase [Proteobacteria bacterium]|nr:tyrosine--tRNA ligase [Pseudomonadota bacterium]
MHNQPLSTASAAPEVDSALQAEVDRDLEFLSRGAAEIISREDLRAKLLKSRQTGTPLRIKLGLDPTAPHIHLGFAVVLRKLRAFQDLGHDVVMLIGDFTARVGDPSGRNETRPVLTQAEIEQNATTYREQFAAILDSKRTIVEFNSTWLGAMSFADVIGLAAKYTVARILERDDFTKRYNEGRPIHMHEMLYPLMQGYDSVALRSDVELGGTDQKFNNLVGRELQREYGQEPQVVFLMPILVGLDGKEKMSKSKGNYVGITEPANAMFTKLMQLPDACMRDYYVLCTYVPMPEVEAMFAELAAGTAHPMDLKKRLAREIIAIYHSAEAGLAAQHEWERVVSQGELPRDIREVTVEAGETGVANLVKAVGLAPSSREARRLVEQGAVEIDGVKHADPRVNVTPASGMVVRAGKQYARVRVG